MLDKDLKILLAFILLDIVSGLCSAVFFGKSKSGLTGISSKFMYQSGIKKVFILGVVGLGHLLDILLDTSYMRTAVCMYFIATEGISTLEHCATMGLPLPKFLYNVLDLIRKQADEGGEKYEPESKTVHKE